MSRQARTVAGASRMRTTFARAAPAPSANVSWDALVRYTRVQAILLLDSNFVDSGQPLPELPLNIDFSLGATDEITKAQKMQLLGFIYQLQLRGQKLAMAVANGEQERVTKLKQKLANDLSDINKLNALVAPTTNSASTPIKLLRTARTAYPTIPALEQLRDKRQAEYEWSKFSPEIVYLDIPCDKCSSYTLVSYAMRITRADEAGHNEIKCFTCGMIKKQ